MLPIVCSIRHTGTWFTLKVLQDLIKPKPDIKAFDIKSEDCILWKHFELVNDSFVSELSKISYERQVVIPCRNPLLSFTTHILRDYGTPERYKKDIRPEQRLSFIRNHLLKYKKILDLEKQGKCYIFDWETAQTYKEKKAALKALAKHLDLNVRLTKKRVNSLWQPVNSTKAIVKDEDLGIDDITLKKAAESYKSVPRKIDIDFMGRVKDELQNDRSDLFRRVFFLEHEVLRRSFEIKEALLEMGYEKLGW